jgi:hypothetical protein
MSSANKNKAAGGRRLLRRLVKLGASNFEDVDETHRRQADMLRRLERAGVDHGYYAGLADCQEDHCGLVKCAERCWFGARRRWLADTVAAHALLRQCRGPLYEVRIIRESWERPIGKLTAMSIGAATQFNRHRLDAQNAADVVVIGMYKVAVDVNASLWMGEIHAIAAGIDKVSLRHIYSVSRARPGYSNNYFWAEEVTNLAKTVVEVLRPDFRVWEPPLADQAVNRPTKRQRAEFYTWLLRLDPGERLIRYGCDKYFNQLTKKPRVVPPKIEKKRPYPHWLSPYMYGSHTMKCTCHICVAGQHLGHMLSERQSRWRG